MSHRTKRPSKLHDGQRIPLWLKISHNSFVCLLVPIYWKQYGPGNFLWFSDIALLLITLALWIESSLLASMMALSVGLLELVWNFDFLFELFTGASLIGLSSYMFDSKLSLPLRALSLFHVELPILLFWTIGRLGYDRRAWVSRQWWRGWFCSAPISLPIAQQTSIGYMASVRVPVHGRAPRSI
jgi:hypothetical protein